MRPTVIVVCVSNVPRLVLEGAEAELAASPHLSVGAAYRAEPAGDGWLRVWDDRGEDSLYPAAMFDELFGAEDPSR